MLVGLTPVTRYDLRGRCIDYDDEHLTPRELINLDQIYVHHIVCRFKSRISSAY